MINMRQMIEERLQALENIGRLQRQRMIKQLLQDLFSDGLIHALSIKATTPDEYFH